MSTYEKEPYVPSAPTSYDTLPPVLCVISPLFWLVLGLFLDVLRNEYLYGVR